MPVVVFAENAADCDISSALIIAFASNLGVQKRRKPSTLCAKFSTFEISARRTRLRRTSRFWDMWRLPFLGLE